MDLPKPLDSVDRRILRCLVEDGRISNRELADRIGLSASPCWQRVRRLEQDGVISGYHARLDPGALGVPELVLVEVTLERHDDTVLDTFGAALAEMPEVLEVLLTTGEYDYILKVAVAGTEDYERFLRRKLYKVPGIRHSRSMVVLRRLKEVRSPLP